MLGFTAGKADVAFCKIDAGRDSNEIKSCWDVLPASSTAVPVSPGTEVEGRPVRTRDE